MNQNKQNPQLSPFSYHFEDGLPDIFIGTIILQQGLSLLFSQLNIFGDAFASAAFLICLILYAAIILLWKHVTLPRLKNAVSTPVKKKSFTLFFRITAITVIFVLISGVLLSQILAGTAFYHQLLIQVLPMIIALGLGAYFLEISRLFLYAALVVFAFPVGRYISILIGWVYLQPILIITSAVIVMTIGLTFFIRFIISNKR